MGYSLCEKVRFIKIISETKSTFNEMIDKFI